MKVVLLRDVVGVGQKGAIKKVSDGYAMNFLIPRKYAEAATSQKVAQVERLTKENEVRAVLQERQWSDYLERLRGAHVTLREAANEKGQLYRQIGMSEISERLQVELGISIPADSIKVSQPVKSVGHSTVLVQLGSRTTELEVIVESKKS